MERFTIGEDNAVQDVAAILSDIRTQSLFQNGCTSKLVLVGRNVSIACRCGCPVLTVHTARASNRCRLLAHVHAHLPTSHCHTRRLTSPCAVLHQR